MSERAYQMYWLTWMLATATTGIVAGFFLGHALLLGRFVDWMLMSGRAGVVATTYPIFRQSAGRIGFEVFYVVAALQIVAAIAFAAAAVVTRRRAVLGLIAAIAALAWPTAHYGSGFAATEASVLRSTAEATRETAAAFVAANGPVHLFHVAVLLAGLIALLLVPIPKRD